jgi:membrane fusion protein (multidrug efflux system)
VLIVQNQSQLELKFRLPERSLATVAPGGAITARFEALGAARPAKVLRINPTVDPRTRTFEVVAVLDNADGALKPGLLAEVDLAPTPAAAKGK